ncbi:MAG: DUF1588 domain-containing protein, partial [Phycisphaeraceae bacterium]|nr:DUF1588 domain-containing protein [Phycisphaeraceae bacterium]
AVTAIMAMENQHIATLASRREFLEAHIARLCEEYYGPKNAAMLPRFVPVELPEPPKLKEGEKYKKAPIHVARKQLQKLGALEFVFLALQKPEHKNKSDEAFKAYCERTWFYYGDHKRKIQGRMTLLRDYLPEFRKSLAKDKRKYKLKPYKPLNKSEMATLRAGILKHRKKGDHYNAVIERCMDEWAQEFKEARIKAGPPSDELLSDLIEQLFVLILERSPRKTEADEHLALARAYVAKLGNLKGVQKLIQTVILSSEFVYRYEFGSGKPDKNGRRMLSPRDASYAIAYALTDQSPDAELAKAAAEGRLNTREDYRREVERILKRRDLHYMIDRKLSANMRDNVTDAPIRKLRFFREFFGYPKALGVFKDEKRFGGDRLGNATKRLLNEADRLVEYILEKDKNVFEELLATDNFYVYHDGDNERMKARSDEIKRIYAYFKDKPWQDFRKKDLLKHADFLRTVNMRMVDPDKPDRRNRQGDILKLFKMSMRSIVNRMDDGQKHPAPFDLYRGYGNDFMPGYNVGKFWNHDLDNWHYQPIQPAKVPNRKGLLTHPAWLIAHAQNAETDPVIRGKWIRERLLAGTIPDVPITVDASIPEDHNKTLRQRLASATEDSYCWKCHKLMNPLGYAFEMYDDFGRFRTEESLEYPVHLIKKGPKQKGDHLVDTRNTYKTLPVDSSGHLDGTGDKALDGKVAGAIDLVKRLARSRRVRQSIIRHAFRYFLGRNERLSDSKTLMDAEKAYVDNDGSFDAVIVSLLTSDSFIYRKAIEDSP